MNRDQDRPAHESEHLLEAVRIRPAQKRRQEQDCKQETEKRKHHLLLGAGFGG